MWKLTHCALVNCIYALKTLPEICSAFYLAHCCCSITEFPLPLSPDYNLGGEFNHGISEALYSPSPCDPNVGLTRTYGLILLIKPLGSALGAKLTPLPGGPHCSASGPWRTLSVHPCTAACGSWWAGGKEVRERRACSVCRVTKHTSFRAKEKREKMWGKKKSPYACSRGETWAQSFSPHPQHEHLLPSLYQQTPNEWEKVEDTDDFS